MKVMFRNNLRLEPHFNGHKFQLINDFIVYVTHYDTTIIPSGFWTDFASIPHIFQSFIPVLDKHLRAAVLHDYMYYAQELNGRKITRAKADKIFLIAMKACGVAWFKRELMYSAVRIGGWVAYNKYKNDRIKNKDIK
jgi:hypothetical protein